LDASGDDGLGDLRVPVLAMATILPFERRRTVARPLVILLS
jgi:hypothetical protein